MVTKSGLEKGFGMKFSSPSRSPESITLKSFSASQSPAKGDSSPSLDSSTCYRTCISEVTYLYKQDTNACDEAANSSVFHEVSHSWLVMMAEQGYQG